MPFDNIEITDCYNPCPGAGAKNVPGPDAPSANATWGTVAGSGVYKGTDSAVKGLPGPAAVVWTARNGDGWGALRDLRHPL